MWCCCGPGVFRCVLFRHCLEPHTHSHPSSNEEHLGCFRFLGGVSNAILGRRANTRASLLGGCCPAGPLTCRGRMPRLQWLSPNWPHSSSLPVARGDLPRSFSTLSAQDRVRLFHLDFLATSQVTSVSCCFNCLIAGKARLCTRAYWPLREGLRSLRGKEEAWGAHLGPRGQWRCCISDCQVGVWRECDYSQFLRLPYFY